MENLCVEGQQIKENREVLRFLSNDDAFLVGNKSPIIQV